MRKLLSLTAFLVFAMLFALEFWRGSQSAVLANNIPTSVLQRDADANIAGATTNPIYLPLISDRSVSNSTGTDPFDALYATNFSLQALSADTIPLVSKPGVKATSLSNPSYIDPVYGTRIYRITAATDFPDATFVRHDYSRRQAFNADNSRFIATASNGNWLLYNANTFQMLPRTGGNGALRGPAGDCEMIWHPTDPKKLWYMSGNGLIWYEKDVETDQDTVLVDFTGRLPWSQATTVWTKSEGTSSADGRVCP